MNVPKRFINAIGGDPGNCVLVVGAGLSKKGVRKGGAGLPDWDGLMKLMIAHLQESGRYNKAAINKLRAMMKEDPPRYLDVAEEFYRAHEHDADGYEQFLRQHLAPSDLVDSEVHKVILNVGFRGIISYNFDMVFEKQSDRLDKVVYPSLLEQVGRFRRKGFFAKIHGCITGPAKQIVLTRTSYERLAADVKYSQLMRTVFLGHVVLCVGFSLRDPDFQSILSDLKNCWGIDMPPLYALMPDPGEDTRREWLTKGVDILPYEDHSDALDFFRKLGTSTGRRRVAEGRSLARKLSRPATAMSRTPDEKDREAADTETARLESLVEQWTKNLKIGEINASVSEYLERLPTVAAKEATLFRIAALCPDSTPFLCPHLLTLGTRGCMDLASRIFCGSAKERSLYQLPPHPLHLPLHRWVLKEKLWEHGNEDAVMRWLLDERWNDHGVDLKATFREMFEHVQKNPEREGMDDLYAAAQDIPGAAAEIERLVFSPGFIRGSGWREESIVREIRERKYKLSLRDRNLPPQELLDAAQEADKGMPDADAIICVADAVRTLLREFPHCTYLTLHGSSSAYDPSKAREILDALASLRKPEQQGRVIAGINHWGVFEERSSHSGEEAELLRKGLLIPLWWRYSSEMRVEYFRYGPKERMMLGHHWTGQELLLHDLMGMQYDIDEDFRREFNRSPETYRTPEEKAKFSGRYEPRLLQELWRDRELNYEISEECPPELIRRLATRRIDWDKLESGSARWDESKKRVAELLEANDLLRDYLSAERSNYVIDNLLGSYDPQRRKVTLYSQLIRFAARELGVDQDAVSTVVYIHETVHAFSHIGRDLNGHMWDSPPPLVADSPDEQISQAQEAIAQYYTYKLLDWLGDDRLFKAFLALEKVCSPVYRIWRQTEQYSLEQMRAVLIRYRSASSEWPPGP
jgi:hypothetical protein